MKPIIFCIAFISTLSCKSQDTIRVSDSEYLVKKSISSAVADSLVNNEEEQISGYSAISVKTKSEISNEISNLMKKLDNKHYKKLIGNNLYFITNVSKTGKALSTKFKFNYSYSQYFNQAIINYLNLLKYHPAYIFSKKGIKYINDQKRFQIRIQ